MYLPLRKRLIDFLHVHQFLDFHDLTGHVSRDWVKDCCHSLFEAEGVEDHILAEGETDGGAHESYTEVGHFGGHFDCSVRSVFVVSRIAWDGTVEVLLYDELFFC